jgi:DNA-binding response OmpR family regulator
LQIYGKVVERAGYRALTAEARFGGVKFPIEPVDLVLLDYHLAGLSAVEIAGEIQARLPGVPILVLSDAYSLPEDIAPLVQGFVRKGDPAKLIATLHEFRSRWRNGSPPDGSATHGGAVDSAGRYSPKMVIEAKEDTNP